MPVNLSPHATSGNKTFLESVGTKPKSAIPSQRVDPTPRFILTSSPDVRSSRKELQDLFSAKLRSAMSSPRTEILTPFTSNRRKDDDLKYPRTGLIRQSNKTKEVLLAPPKLGFPTPHSDLYSPPGKAGIQAASSRSPRLIPRMGSRQGDPETSHDAPAVLSRISLVAPPRDIASPSSSLSAPSARRFTGVGMLGTKSFESVSLSVLEYF